MWLSNVLFHQLQLWDTRVLIFINRKLANPVFDALLPWVRDSIIWVPFYVFLITWGLLNLGKKSVWWVIFAFLTVGISDQVSSGFIKNTVARVRPCRDPEVLPQIILRLENCSGAFSFTSSHAANHFALAMFVFVSFRGIIPGNITRWIFAWAALISYAQMYVGVHYPLDVAGGALVGLICGYTTAFLFKKRTQNL